MAWKAKITGIVRIIILPGPSSTPAIPPPEVAYEITAEFWLVANPAVAYTKKRVLPQGVTQAQVLAAIKNELQDLEAGDTIQTTIAPHIDEEIDANTNW